MALDWFFASWPIFLGVTLVVLQLTGALRFLARRPAVLMMMGLFVGLIYRSFSLPVAQSNVIGDFADICLAALVFAATLQFRLTRIIKHSPATFNLAVLAGPAYAVAAALSAYVLLPSLSIWSCLVIGAALMLNGGVVDRRTVLGSSVPNNVKSGVSLESAVILALGMPLLLLLEATALTPSTHIALVQTPVFGVVIGFATGGTAGLLGAKWLRRKGRLYGTAKTLLLTMMIGILAFALTSFVGGNAIIATAAAGILLSEDSAMSAAHRKRFLYFSERALVPTTCFVFGFTLGPRVLQADILVLLFALSAVTLLRVLPRLIALKKLSLPSDQQAFLAWFGGAPGIATALFFLRSMGNPLVVDQEQVLTIGATCVLVSILGTRLSSRPLAKYFVRQSALARKRQFYAR